MKVFNNDKIFNNRSFQKAVPFLQANGKLQAINETMVPSLP